MQNNGGLNLKLIHPGSKPVRLLTTASNEQYDPATQPQP
jgi:hypothetical protein